MNKPVLPNEALIADDGSTDHTRQIIEKYTSTFKLPIIYQWQEGKGFRKATIINKTVAQSTSDYIIQVDGDCILHRRFIEDHIQYAQINLYLYGTRVHIKQQFVQKVLTQKKRRFSFFSKMITKRFRGVYLPFLSVLFTNKSEISSKFRGCNTSFWKKDFIAINGYNEDFEGWGREDSDLMIRLHNLGVKGKRLKFCGIVYRLDHPEKDRSHFTTNHQIQKKTIEKRRTYIANGIDKYL